MKARINTSGTHVQNGVLKVRVDLYPDPDDKTYTLHYVDKFDREPTQDELDDPEKLALVPNHKELNPCLCHFIEVPEDITGEQLLEYVQQLFTPDCLATLDEALAQPDSAHRISPYMRSQPRLAGAATVQATDTEALVAAVNIRLGGLEFDGGKGEPANIEPQSIDIGAPAIDRSSTATSKTIVEASNPANASGTIDTFQLYVATELAGCKAGTAFVVSGNNLTTRDYESIGTVAAGSMQQFSGLNIDCASGDYARVGYSSGVMERDNAGTGYWVGGSDLIPFTDQALSWYATRIVSLYGTGTESGGATDKTSSDSAQGVDEAATVATLTGSESGSGTESMGPRAFGTSDAGTGAEGAPVGTASLAAGDTGQGTEYAHILGLWEVLFAGDAGRASDSLKALAVKGGHETGLRAGPGRVGIPHKEVKL